MWEISKCSFGEDLNLIAMDFERANFLSTNFEDINLRIMNFIPDNFFHLMRNILISLFIMPRTPLMRLAIRTYLNENIRLTVVR